MKTIQAAIYARVSSERQATAQTIASQLAALRERVAADGCALPEAMQFLDDGYSGTTLVQPALERLRDLVAAGAVDRLYIHSPDRLARKYAYQVLLVDEFRRTGVEVIFLNRELGRSPEDDLLLQVQGMMAEYERAKIVERHRRGKLHAARAGVVNVLAGAPYGYRYIDKHAGGGQARYEILPDEARVVRQVFDWVGRDRLTIGEVCRRLTQAGERTRTGRTVWERSVVGGSCTILPIRVAQRLGKRAKGPCVRVCGPSGAARCSRDAPPPTMACRPPNGSQSPSRPWWTLASLPPSRSSYKIIAVMRGNLAGAHAICCKAWCNVSSVAMPSTANRSVAPRPRARPVPTRITGAWERMPIALAGNGSVPIPRCGPISWTSQCGGKSRDCWPTPNAWRKNISVGCRPPPRGRARHRPRSRPRLARCARGWRG